MIFGDQNSLNNLGILWVFLSDRNINSYQLYIKCVLTYNRMLVVFINVS